MRRPDSNTYLNVPLNLEPLPILPSEMKALIPQVGSPLCDRFTPGLTAYMKAWSDIYSWMFTEEGEISCQFQVQLCQMTCIGGGSSQTCPLILFTTSILVGNTTLDVTFNGAGLDVGRAYKLYRATDPLGVWTEIDSDVTVGSTITFADTGLVNGTVYYYRIVLPVGACPEQIYPDPASGVNVTGTPSLCRALLLQLATYKDFSFAPGSIQLRAYTTDGAGIPAASTWAIYRSVASGELGSLVASGAIGDATADCTGQAGGAGLCYTDTGLGECTRYYWTVRIQESGSCPEYELGVNDYAWMLPARISGLAAQGGPGGLTVAVNVTGSTNIGWYNYQGFDQSGNQIVGGGIAADRTSLTSTTRIPLPMSYVNPDFFAGAGMEGGTPGQQGGGPPTAIVRYELVVTPFSCNGIAGNPQRTLAMIQVRMH